MLLRLEHQFAVNEDAELSKPVVVQLKGLFKDFEIVSLTQLNLAANRVINSTKTTSVLDWITAMWKNSVHVRFDDDFEYSVTLNAMEIRTLKLDVKWNGSEARV